jgi:hypothetical protein
MNQPPPGYGYPPQGYGYPPQGPPPKKGMSGWLIALIVVGSIFVVSGGGCVVCVALVAHGSSASGGSRATPGNPTPTRTAPATAETVDLVTLLSEYKGNEVRGDAEYKGKLIQVTGKVGAIKKDILDHMYVIVGTGKQFEIPAVQCTLREENAGAATSLTKGQSITVRGEVHGLMMNVQLGDCDIL